MTGLMNRSTLLNYSQKVEYEH